ncbi:MAG: valine--tRNA ligase [Lachnospiraceae bacterium]|nr:valine--tRNA ligase [Lachnospiraceae bacterium]
MSTQLSKTYDPAGMEGRLYEKWEKSGYFHAEADRSRKPFTIVMPPPNITGQLHMGHALDNTMQDILIRFKRMQGYNALWQPGTDHASIATEVRVMSELKKQGIDKHELGREKFLERVWDWRREYGGRITKQLRKLGSSCDWERERFTMDEGCNRAVTEVFVNLYNKGLIYKGARIINWCPVCNTSISDAEVEYVEQPSHLWHIKYPLMGDDGKPSTTDFLTFATTRPETMLGDTAVAVHPDDERYTHLHGRTVWLPIVNKEIPVVEDTYVDMEFGTGVVKITPGHDPNDFEVGKRHDLPIVNVMNDDGTINENGGRYNGMTDLEARAAIVEELKQLGLLEKIEDYAHNVGTHDRCGTTIQPLVKQQWFVRMDELIKPARSAVANGDIRLVPPRMDRTYFNWTDNIRDWCISRQLWWGHRIPAYYCSDCGEMIVSKEAVHKCSKCGSTNITQDEDTLDTWFSSALWPFSTLGWPDDTPELDYFYPTDVLVTGYDIIFFWVIRMIFSGYEHMGAKPFSTVLFHGLVRDGQGRKMSKSLGNGIDPLEVIEKYGADALRFTLVTGNAPGNDMRFTDERVEASRNFANKVWNASRFIMMNMEGKTITKPSEEELWPVDRWVLSKLNKVVAEVTDNMEKYELGIAAAKVYDFVYDVLCDWYIEMIKPRFYNTDDATGANAALYTVRTVLIDSLKLLHPYMPFITEEIYCTLTEGDSGREADSIMISSWPVYRKEWEYEKEEEQIELIKEAVRSIRNIRSEMNVAPSKKANVIIVTTDDTVRTAFESGRLFFESLAGASSLTIQNDRTGIGDDAVSVMIANATIYIPFAELVDISAEIERLSKERSRLEGEIDRCRKMLGNEKFMSKAPEAKINEEKEKLEKYTLLAKQVEERLAALNG